MVTKVLVALAVVAGISWASTANAEYAAIAFSKSTGEYGYGWGQWSLGAAERIALDNCKAKDAEIVAWVEDGFAALAIGEDDTTYGTGWQWGDGATNIDAINRAKDNCTKRGQRVKTLVVVASDTFAPKVYK
jgi:hypothetical protein